MTTHIKCCSHDEDYAKVSLFFLENRHDLHPAYSTMDMVYLIYCYITQGHLLYIEDEEHQVIAASAYYVGTPEHDFTDKDIALLDIAIFNKAYRGTRLFIRGLCFKVNLIIERHPEVQELRLVAHASNNYVSKLYSKLTTSSYSREGPLGEEIIFCVKIHQLRATLNRFSKV
jgi:hypothetical protein